ncbi:MAG: ABC transporter permease subunit, partial [Candidatus Latescibacteria bacterium]|nr:ABC transporter permease subunit [Candidatus Latescibacterota bacterium]
EMSSEYGIRKGWGLNLPLPIRPLEGAFPGASPDKEGTLYLHVMSPPELQKSIGELTPDKLFPPVTITFVITIIGTLLTILIAHDVVTREKETGTLGLTLSNSVSRDILLFAKWIGNFFTVWFAFTLFFLISVLLLTLVPTQFSLDGQWNRLVLIYVVSLLLLSLFFNFGLLFSTLTHNSRNALILLLFSWALFVYVIPDISPYAAGAFRKLPSVQEILAKHLELSLQFEESRSERQDNLFVSEGENSQEQMDKVFEEIMERNIREVNQLDREFRSRLNNQVALARTLSSLSPVAVGTFLITDIAGTGIIAHENLGSTIQEYWETVCEEWSFLEEMGDLPEFSERELNWKEIFVRDRIDVILLLVLNVVFFLGAYVAFLRYDVR